MIARTYFAPGVKDYSIAPTECACGFAGSYTEYLAHREKQPKPERQPQERVGITITPRTSGLAPR